MIFPDEEEQTVGLVIEDELITGVALIITVVVACAEGQLMLGEV
jgi:hypothetical protein